MSTDFLNGGQRVVGYLKFRIIHGCVPFSMCYRLVASRTATLTGGNYRRLRICEYRDAHPRAHDGKLNAISNALTKDWATDYDEGQERKPSSRISLQRAAIAVRSFFPDTLRSRSAQRLSLIHISEPTRLGMIS